MVALRLAWPRAGEKKERKKKRNEDAVAAATSNGLPTSPRARNSVTVRVVDIADAYSMSDGSSPEGRERMPMGRDGRKVAGRLAIEGDR